MNTAKIAYRPIGLASGVVSGMIAGALFKAVWKHLSDAEEAPSATQRDLGWTEVLLTAAVQGAIFAVVKAAVDRASAQGFRRLTGTWPGDEPGDESGH
jgi:hypothetical protein